jgi:predicted RNA-binding protein YlqC (UPF0109 family)
MSTTESELVKKILETFVTKADQISTALTELRIAISTMNDSQKAIIAKLDELRVELRELSTRIEMALARR